MISRYILEIPHCVSGIWSERGKGVNNDFLVLGLCCLLRCGSLGQKQVGRTRLSSILISLKCLVQSRVEMEKRQMHKDLKLKGASGLEVQI